MSFEAVPKERSSAIQGVDELAVRGGEVEAQHRREVVSDTVDERAPDLAPSADTALDDKRRRALVLRGLERLDFERRTVLVLHDIEGHSMPEIAAALEENVNTLYARLRAARQQFAAAVAALKGGAS